MHDGAVTRRCIFFVGGYDPKSAEAFFGRLAREFRRSEALWGADSRMTLAEGPGADIGTATIAASGDGWSVDATFGFLVMDGIVLRDFSRPLGVRLLKYLAAFAAFVASGAALRMFAKNWRFGLYFLFPFAALLLFACLGAALGRFVALAGFPFAGPVGIVVGAVTFAGCLKWLGGRWPVNHLMDLWSFSRDYLRGRRADADALIGRWAEAIVERVRNGDFDEVLLVGHSTGGALILDVAARCIALDADFSGRARHVALLTLGSTALKVGMHPAAERFRAGVQALVDDHRMEWAEVQCLTDAINFYKSDPVADMRLRPRAAGAFPLVRTVRMKHMLADETYRRIKRNFFRVHYQYIYGNTKPYFYDFFMICCGPMPLSTRMEKLRVGPLRPPETAP
jgi:hypothetical protein